MNVVIHKLGIVVVCEMGISMTELEMRSSEYFSLETGTVALIVWQ